MVISKSHTVVVNVSKPTHRNGAQYLIYNVTIIMLKPEGWKSFFMIIKIKQRIRHPAVKLLIVICSGRPKLFPITRISEEGRRLQNRCKKEAMESVIWRLLSLHHKATDNLRKTDIKKKRKKTQSRYRGRYPLCSRPAMPLYTLSVVKC